MEIEEKIKKIEEEIRTTPYHKATEHHIGKLRAKLSRLRDELLTPKKGGKKMGFAIKKEGDATVVLLGFPSVGKSTLLNKLTQAKSKVADYDFTTLTVIPGVLKLNGALIQVLDLPGIISEASKGKGWGRQILSAARAADLLLILLDAQKLEQEDIVRDELFKAGVRINQKPPKVLVKKKDRGGLQINSPTLSNLTKSEVKEFASEFGLKNAEIIIKEDLNQEQLIDAFAQNRVYLPTIFVINKIDLILSQQHRENISKVKSTNTLEVKEFEKRQISEYIFISAKENLGLENLKKAIWDKLGLIRIYLKPKHGEPDFNEPLILKKGATVLDVSQKISQKLSGMLKGAILFGPKALYQGQKVGIHYKLADSDIITLV